jgi:hypothetical protein
MKPIVLDSDAVRQVLKDPFGVIRVPVEAVRIEGSWSPFSLSWFRCLDPHDTDDWFEAVKQCPYGKAGDALWVKETWADVNTSEGPAIAYKADESFRSWHEFSITFGPDEGAGPSMDYDAYPGDYVMWFDDLISGEPDHEWREAKEMPQWASRLKLGLTHVDLVEHEGEWFWVLSYGRLR